MNSETLNGAALGAPPATAGANPVSYDCLEAVQAFFRSRADLRAATADGKLWEAEAKEGTPYPFAEQFLVSEGDEATSTGPFKVCRTTLQISCHAATQQAAKDLRNRFEAALYHAPLSVQGAPVLHCLPQAPASGKGEGKGPKGQDSFMATVDLEILWVKPLPMLFRS